VARCCVTPLKIMPLWTGTSWSLPHTLQMALRSYTPGLYRGSGGAPRYHR
jgi:hypothetical protein